MEETMLYRRCEVNPVPLPRGGPMLWLPCVTSAVMRLRHQQRRQEDYSYPQTILMEVIEVEHSSSASYLVARNKPIALLGQPPERVHAPLFRNALRGRNQKRS